MSQVTQTIEEYKMTNIMTTVKVVEDRPSEMAVCQKKVDLLKKMATSGYDGNWVKSFGTLEGLVAVMPLDHKVTYDNPAQEMGVSFIIETCRLTFNMGSRVLEYPRELEMGRVDGVNHALATVVICDGDWDTAVENATVYLNKIVEIHDCTTAVIMAEKTLTDIKKGKLPFMMNVSFS